MIPLVLSIMDLCKEYLLLLQLGTMAVCVAVIAKEVQYYYINLHARTHTHAHTLVLILVFCSNNNCHLVSVASYSVVTSEALNQLFHAQQMLVHVITNLSLETLGDC